MTTENILNYIRLINIAIAACLICCSCSGHEEQKPAYQAEPKTSHQSVVKKPSLKDGTDSGTHSHQQQNEALRTNSSPPDFEVSLQPSAPVTGDRLTAKVKYNGESGYQTNLTYVWLINGENVQESEEPDLEQAIHRGDFVELRVALTGTPSSEDAKSCSTFVGNAPPDLKIVNQNMNETGLYQAQIEASDPEKDPTSVSLKKAPPGMLIDQQSQIVKWVVAPDQQGTFDVAISAKDAHGAETLLTYQVKVAWQEGERSKGHDTSSAKTQ